MKRCHTRAWKDDDETQSDTTYLFRHDQVHILSLGLEGVVPIERVVLKMSPWAKRSRLNRRRQDRKPLWPDPKH